MCLPESEGKSNGYVTKMSKHLLRFYFFHNTMDAVMATTKDKKSITIPIPSRINGTQLLVALLIIFAFGLGALSMRVYQLETGKTLGAQTGTTPAPAAPAEDTSPREVSLDDDPVIGDKNAPVTIVEFSDYECPFCKRHFTDTYPQIKRNIS